ncbi:MAG: tetratricopeptide repeat protein [Acidobacteriota bacterium]|nr:tetratricopeptide repeat protein [Acidobacteriota bacterium]
MITGFLLLFAWIPTEDYVVPDVDILEMNDAMRDFLRENVGDVYDPHSRLKHLVHLVFDERFLNLSYDNTHTKTAVQTFESRNGNCLSFTNMFVAMARHLGLKVSYQEVYNVPTWNKQGNVVLLNRHMNAVVSVNGKSYVIDFNPYQDRVEMRTRLVSDDRARAQYYNNLGAEAFQKRNIEKAEAYFRKAIKIYPSLGFTWSNLGALLAFDEQYDNAEKAYRTAIKNDQRGYTAMSNLARLYRKTGKDKLAAELESKVERYRKRNPYFHFALGEEQYELGNFEEAIKHYKDAVRRKRKEHEFHFALSRAYVHVGNMERSEYHLKKAREYAPDVFNRNRYNEKLDRLALLR